ncbi:class II fructose-bisphosphate aldolase [uncultured Sphaerochaeta sp.]|uniref:class II fructose-bisphosphate aldolase n=1 Tax=uncultured Sphaerochaeta sp. TaxID=886478 RepID=UPI002A0A84FF|nr:class II fructose-bisphosphate aldolase [uncultured Sphaerochaeta sp.]
MSLVPFTEMLRDAKEHHYTIGAFNILNMETIQAVLSASEKMKAPVILQVFHSHVDYAGADYLAAMAAVGANKSKYPVCLSLDHGQDFQQAKTCVDQGFTGVMIDLATSNYDENVRTTTKVVDLAHKKGVSVEAELGQIFLASCPLEVRNSGMTNPEIAAKFAKDTNIDALAVSIGTAHGFYSSKPSIDYPRLKKILDLVGCPIVVHGGSNTPDDDIRAMVKMGISKLNIGTDLMAAFEKGMQDAMKVGEYIDIQEVLEAGIANEEKVCCEKIKLLTMYKE